MAEARIWQIVGALGVLLSALVLYVAIADFDAAASSPASTYADGLWALARGFLSAFPFTISVAALISAHVLRVADGARHRTHMWLPAAGVLGLTGIVLAIRNGTWVADQIAAGEIEPFWMKNGLPEAYAGCFLIVLAALILLGDRMASRVARASRQLS